MIIIKLKQENQLTRHPQVLDFSFSWLDKLTKNKAQSTGTVEYIDCISAEG